MQKRWMFLLAVLIAFPLIMSTSGCTVVQDAYEKIPLFNPKATTLNRIYSAKEILVQLNRSVHEFVQNGWITQDYVDKHIGPILDDAQKSVEEAETLYKNHNEAAATSEIQTSAASLRSILAFIDQLKKEHAGG